MRTNMSKLVNAKLILDNGKFVSLTYDGKDESHALKSLEACMGSGRIWRATNWQVGAVYEGLEVEFVNTKNVVGISFE